MVRDDVAWLYSMSMSSHDSPWQGPLGVTLAPHMARVVHEGIDFLSHRRPDVARSLKRDLSAAIEQARHTIKLVHDDHRSVVEILAAFDEIAELHAARFSFGPDLAIASWRGSPIYSSRSAEYQTLAAITAPDPHGTSVTMGQSMATILQSGFGVPVPRWTQLDLPEAEAPESVDYRGKSYYPDAYPGLDGTAEKDLLLTVETSLNAAALYRACTQGRFIGPVFRTQLLSFVHAVSTISTLATRPGMRIPDSVMQLLEEEHWQWLAKQSALRNRAMHYGVPPQLSGVSADAPMYGLVEAITGRTFAEVDAHLIAGSARLGEELASWRGA